MNDVLTLKRMLITIQHWIGSEDSRLRKLSVFRTSVATLLKVMVAPTVSYINHWKKVVSKELKLEVV